jgi:hypothetical protein
VPVDHWLYSHPRVRLSRPLVERARGVRRLIRPFVENARRYRAGQPLIGSVDRELDC